MPYKPALFIVFIGLILYFFGYFQDSVAMQVGGIVLTGSMFAVYMTKKLTRR